MLKRIQTFQKRSPQRNIDNSRKQLCHKCGSPNHFIKFCPLWDLEYKKNNPDKAKKGKGDIYVPNNRRMTIQEADLSIKNAFTAMGGMSEDESKDEEAENQSLLAIEQVNKYDFLALVSMIEAPNKESTCQAQDAIYALMAGSNSDDEEEDKHDLSCVRLTLKSQCNTTC